MQVTILSKFVALLGSRDGRVEYFALGVGSVCVLYIWTGNPKGVWFLRESSRHSN